MRKKGIPLTVNGQNAFTWEGPLMIRKCALTPVSGQGRRLR